MNGIRARPQGINAGSHTAIFPALRQAARASTDQDAAHRLQQLQAVKKRATAPSSSSSAISTVTTVTGHGPVIT